MIKHIEAERHIALNFAEAGEMNKLEEKRV